MTVDDWSDFFVPLVGLIGVVMGSVITRRGQIAEQEEAKNQDLRRVVGALNVLLVDSLPARIAVNLSREHSPGEINELKTRWKTLKPELAGHAALDSNPLIRDYATGILVAMDNLLTFDGWIVSDHLHNQDLSDSREQADEHYDEAYELLGKLLRAVRGESRPARKPLLQIWWSEPIVEYVELAPGDEEE